MPLSVETQPDFSKGIISLYKVPHVSHTIHVSHILHVSSTLQVNHTLNVSHTIRVSDAPVTNCVSGFFQLRAEAEETIEYRTRLLLFSDVFFVRCKLKYNFVFSFETFQFYAVKDEGS